MTFIWDNKLLYLNNYYYISKLSFIIIYYIYLNTFNEKFILLFLILKFK